MNVERLGREKRHAELGVCGGLVLCLLGCGSDATAPNGPPGHTVVRGNVAHAPGLETPELECVSCHGVNLRGGAEGEPSCFSCHGKTWP